MPGPLLLNLDVGPLGALLRALLGAGLVLVLRALWPGAPWPVAAVALVLALFGVKAFAAVARRLIPASPSARAHLEWRRNLARFHDSYQWRKLAAVGLGMLAAARLRGPAESWELPLSIACLLAGAVAEIVWRRKGLPLIPPLRA